MAPPPSSKPAKSGRGKKKKKSSKGKQKEKVNNMVFDKVTYDKLLSEPPKFELTTPSIPSDRLRGILLGIEAMSLPDEMFSQFINRKKTLLIEPPGTRVDHYIAKYSPFVSEHLSFNIKRKVQILEPHVRDLMKFKSMDFSESMEFIVPLSKVMDEIIQIVHYEPRVAEDGLKPPVVELIVKILREIDKKSIKVSAIYILMVSRLDKCNPVTINEAIQVLVDHMCTPVAVRAMYALIRLTLVFPDHASVIVQKNAINVALDVVTNCDGEHAKLDAVADLLVVVCQIKLSPHEERAALTILDKLIQTKCYNDTRSHIVRACDALQYLSFKKDVELEEQAFKRIIALISHTNNTVVSSALGVVGNIARWGRVDQLEILAKDGEFHICLGKTMRGKPEEFLKEACQIISQIAAARDRTFIKAMGEAGLIDNLCSLLELAKSDVKMEVRVLCEKAKEILMEESNVNVFHSKVDGENDG